MSTGRESCKTHAPFDHMLDRTALSQVFVNHNRNPTPGLVRHQLPKQSVARVSSALKRRVHDELNVLSLEEVSLCHPRPLLFQLLFPKV